MRRNTVALLGLNFLPLLGARACRRLVSALFTRRLISFRELFLSSFARGTVSVFLWHRTRLVSICG